MTTRTSPRARSRSDRAGDPLDGLVNLFDLGIVLSVAFLLAALSSLKLTGVLSHKAPAQPNVTVAPGQKERPLDAKPNQRVIGQGTRIGAVYRLADGRVVYVTGR